MLVFKSDHIDVKTLEKYILKNLDPNVEEGGTGV